MIIIKTHRSEFEHQYKGNIEIYIDEPFLCVNADRILQLPDDVNDTKLNTLNSVIYDKFWIKDIKSIEGK